MSFFKKLTAALLVGAMVVQAAVPSFAAGTDNADNTYYYTAIGDSATAGYNLDTLTTSDKQRQNYMRYTYKNTFKDSYPNLVANALRSALVEEGYLADEKKFDFSNMGTIAFRTVDFLNVLNDEEYINALNKDGYWNAYGEVYNEYKADPGAFYSKTKAKDAADFRSNAEALKANFNNSTAKAYFSSVGLRWRNQNEFDAFYNKNCSSDEVFNTFYDGVYDNYYYNTYLPRIRGDAYKYHDIFVEEYSKADMISVNIGANDLLLNLMLLLRDQGYARKNPILVVLYATLKDIILGGDELTVFVNLVKNKRTAKPQTTEAHVQEANEFLSDENIQKILKAFTDQATTTYPQVIEKIKEINKNAGKNAQMVYMGTYYPYGNAPDLSQYEDDMEQAEAEQNRKAVADDAAEEYLAVVEPTFTMVPSEDLPGTGDDFMDDEMDEFFIQSEEAGAVVLNAGSTAVDDYYNNVLSVAGITALMNQIGEASVPCMNTFNKFVKDFAAKEDCPFVDIYGVADEETDLDPHPIAKTHKKIADRIIDTVVLDITKNVEGSGKVEGPSKCVYGHDVDFTATPDSGSKLASLKIGSDDATNPNAESAYEFTAEAVKADTAITATFEAIATETESTEVPTEAPTEAPTQAPTEAPTEAPTQAPTEAPTEAPTQAPTEASTEAPTPASTETTAAPVETTGSSDSEASGRTYRLRFVSNGGTAYETVRYKKGTVIDLNEYVPTREGYIFQGWYTNFFRTNKVQSDTITINGNTTLYARWTRDNTNTAIGRLFNNLFGRYENTYGETNNNSTLRSILERMGIRIIDNSQGSGSTEPGGSTGTDTPDTPAVPGSGSFLRDILTGWIRRAFS
jgi:uncharacterized repeat protein (TIGR02543 family)